MDPKNGEDDKQIAETADGISQAVRIGEISAHAVKEHVPQRIKAVGKIAEIVKETVNDPSSSGKGEKFFCAAASEIVKGMIATPCTTAAVVAGAAGGPIGAAMAGATVSAIVMESARPVGELVQTTCHAGFDWLKGPEKARVCVKDTLLAKSDIGSSISSIAHSGQSIQQFLAPIAKSFLIPNDVKSQNTRSITPLLAAAIGVNPDIAMVHHSRNTLALKTGELAYTIAEVSTEAVDKNIENSTYLKDWITDAARNFFRNVNIQKFDEELQNYTSTHLKNISEEKLTVDEIFIFGRALQKGFEDEWQHFVDRKIPRKSNTSISTTDVLGDLKRIKTQIEKADLHKQIRESISAENTTDQDTDRLLIDLLTDIDIKGFEHVNEIKALKAKLDAHKQSSHSTQFDILQAAQKLNTAKSKVAEEEKIKDEYIKNAHHCVDIATNVAYLLGNNTRAQQISVIGNALINVSSVMASIGTMNPLVTASILSGACASIKSLFSRNKSSNSSQMILDALKTLGEQLQTIQREMHERFDQVMATLDDMNRNMVRGFLHLDWKADNIIEQIQALHVELDHLAERQANIGATVVAQMTDLQKSMEHKFQEQESTKIFTLAEKAKRDCNFQSKYSDYVTEVEAHALGPNVGAKHVHIVGNPAATKEKDVSSILKLVTENHLQHRSDYCALNTLLSYLQNINIKGDFHYQPQNLDHLVEHLIKDNQDLVSTPTLGLGSMLINERDLKVTKETPVTSLARTINELKNMDAIIQLIPIQSNGTWHLLVVDTQRETFHYYGIADQLTLNRLFTTLETMKEYEHWRKQTHASCFETGLGPQATALLVIKQCSEIAEQKKPAEVSSTLTQAEAVQLNRKNIDILRSDNRYPQTYTTPSHPFVWQYLSDAFSYLVTKQYPDIQTASLSTDEIAPFQRFIYEGNHILSQLQRLRNDEFIRVLIEKYEEAAKTLSEELDISRTQFEEKISQRIISESKLALDKTLFDTNDLKKQEINVSADYSTGANGGQWFYTTAQEVNLKKGPSGCNSGSGLNDPHGDDIRHEYKTAYKAARVNNINSKKNAFINRIEECRKEEEYRYKMDLCADLACSQHLPMILLTISPGYPVLPMPRGRCYSLIPDTYYHAQMTRQGEIKCVYHIVGDQFELSTHFIQPHHPMPDEQNKISSITIPYKPSFYTGPEAVWWWWFGGNYCDSLQNVSAESIPWTRYASGYCGHVRMYKTISNPICTEHKGLFHDIDQHLKNVKFHNNEMKHKISAQWRAIIHGFRSEWYKELQRTIASDRFSALGKAAASFDACATLLSLVSQIALANKNQPDVFTRLINQHPECVFNQAGLDALLATCPKNNIATMIAPKTETMDLLANALLFLKKMRWSMEFPLFEGARMMVGLLQCMDNYVPNMRKGLSVSEQLVLKEQVLEMDSYIFGALSQGFRAFDMADAAERHERDKLLAKLEQYQEAQREMRERIAGHSPNLRLIKNTPEKMLAFEAAYQQHGFLRSHISVQEVEKKPTIKFMK